MKRYSTEFEELAKGINIKTLEESTHPIYATNKQFQIIYFNEAWVKFAMFNGGGEMFDHEVLGWSILDGMSGSVIKLYHELMYKKVLENGKIWHHDYECSSPYEYRVFHQMSYPFKDKNGLIIVNSLVVHLPMNEVRLKEYEAVEKVYMQPTGYINQCSNCRQVQRVEDKSMWDWVPKWVDKCHEHTSHTICHHCFDYFWKYGSSKKQEEALDLEEIL